MTSNQIRFFLPKILQTGEEARFEEEASHKIRSVLRLDVNSKIFVFDNSGVEFHATIKTIKKKLVEVVIGERLTNIVESSIEITLILAIIRGEKMDYSLQKATELGVTSIRPFFSERTLVRLDGERQPKRYSHWQNILKHAAEQCGRRVIPTLRPIINLNGLDLSEPHAKSLLLDPYTNQKLNDHDISEKKINIICGPEGGFSREEVQNLKAKGALAISLGPRILRAETSSICAISIVQSTWGDINGL